MLIVDLRLILLPLCMAMIGCPIDASPVEVTVAEVEANRPGETSGSAREIAELHSMLSRWVDRPDWPRIASPWSNEDTASAALERDPCPVISARLALFASRYGLEYHDAPGWGALAQLAQHVLDRLVEEYPAPDPVTLRFGDEWVGARWISARALLLDMAGRRVEAQTLLFGDVDRYWDGCCMADLSEALFYLARARAELLDRTGDRQGALRWYHAAWFYCEFDPLAHEFGRPRLGADLTRVRYAWLLADAGELEAAADILGGAGVWDLPGPDTLGMSIAREALRSRLASSFADDVSLFTISLKDYRLGGWDGDDMAFAVGDTQDPATWRVLACSVPRFPERRTLSRLLPDCEADFEIVEPDDPRVAALVRR